MARAPEPLQTPLTEPFYAAAAEGRLLIQRCHSTGRYQWYPRAHSVHDIASDVEWVESKGEGQIYTFSVIERSPFEDMTTPYVFAVVELTEGIRMSTNVVDVDPREVYIGMPVHVVFQRRGEFSLPVFVPAGG